MLIPEGSRLLHIGPAKTGTTAVQSAFHCNRKVLARHGVHYAGSSSQPRQAAEAVATGKLVYGHRSGREQWPALVEEVATSTATRVVVSSETFARCQDEAAAKVIEAFGADRTHVVMTMRPLASLLPSAWQQFVKNGSRREYEVWLHALFDDNPPRAKDGGEFWEATEFWQKTRIDEMARRWGALVGFDNVTVVSLAEQPHGFVLRTFEDLVGLPSGVLVPDPASGNPSMNFGAAEVIRLANEHLYSHRSASRETQAKLVEFGSVKFLRTQRLDDTGEPIVVPRWAGERANAVAASMNDGLRRLGVRVIGNIDALTRSEKPFVESALPPASVSTATAAALLYGSLEAAELEIGRPQVRPTRAGALHNIDALPTRALLGVTAQRVEQRLRSRLLRGIGRGRSRP